MGRQVQGGQKSAQQPGLSAKQGPCVAWICPPGSRALSELFRHLRGSGEGQQSAPRPKQACMACGPDMRRALRPGSRSHLAITSCLWQGCSLCLLPDIARQVHSIGRVHSSRHGAAGLWAAAAQPCPSAELLAGCLQQPVQHAPHRPDSPLRRLHSPQPSRSSST